MKLMVYKLYECTALVDSGASLNFFSQKVANLLGWAVSMDNLLKSDFLIESACDW